MRQRLVKLLYVLSLIGIVLFIPIYILAFLPSDKIAISSYKARCLSNNQYVVLQGSQQYDPYVFEDIILNDKTYTDTPQTLNFYCKYYEEIRPYILAYTQSKTNSELVNANSDFWNFRSSVISNVSSYPSLYRLELIKNDIQYYRIIDPIVTGFVIALLLFLLLQVIRICYVYVVFGRINWHPFKDTKNKSVTTKNTFRATEMHTESANTNKREHGSEYGISRLNRAPFIASMLFSFTVILLLVLLNAPIEVAMAFVFVNFVWMILLYTGRFHDVGYSGWWTLLVMCTSVAGLVALAVWPGNKVSNKYGDVPKGLFSSLLTFWHFWR